MFLNYITKLILMQFVIKFINCPRGEMDIITGFEPAVASSNLAEGTLRTLSAGKKHDNTKGSKKYYFRVK